MSQKMSRYPSDRKVYVGDLGNNARKNDLEYAFGAYGTLRSVWIARNPPGFAFVEFEDARDAADAVRGLDGRTVCGRRARVELSTGKFSNSGRRGDRNRNGRNSESKCYECGGRGHYARECRRNGRSRRRSNSRSRSRSPSRSRRSHSRSESSSRSHSRRSREGRIKTKENGRSAENGDSSKYSDNERNGALDSPPSSKRRYNDSTPSPRRDSQSKRRGRSDSRRRNDSSVSCSRSSSRND